MNTAHSSGTALIAPWEVNHGDEACVPEFVSVEIGIPRRTPYLGPAIYRHQDMKLLKSHRDSARGSSVFIHSAANQGPRRGAEGLGG